MAGRKALNPEIRKDINLSFNANQTIADALDRLCFVYGMAKSKVIRKLIQAKAKAIDDQANKAAVYNALTPKEKQATDLDQYKKALEKHLRLVAYYEKLVNELSVPMPNYPER